MKPRPWLTPLGAAFGAAGALRARLYARGVLRRHALAGPVISIGNLAVGGRGEGRPISDCDRWIAEQVAPEMKRRGMLFVGLDVIGDYLTEVNVTSPTGIQELSRFVGRAVEDDVIAWVERRTRQLQANAS